MTTIAPDTPGWAELDHCLVRLRPTCRSRLIAEILRYTGLRLAQARALRVGDYDPMRHALWVASGKTRHEKAGRRIPVAPPLAERLTDAIAGRDSGERIADVSKVSVNRALHRVFEQAELRPEVWSHIPGRHCRRLSHIFRAAFQAELRCRRVDDATLDMLVGHAGSHVRYRHYVRPSWEELTAAVGLVPRVGYAPRVR